MFLLIIKFQYYICPDIYAMGCFVLNETEITLTKPDPDNAGGGKAKQGIRPTPLVIN